MNIRTGNHLTTTHEQTFHALIEILVGYGQQVYT